MRTLTLAGCGPLFRSRDPRTVLREEQRTMRTRVFVVPLFAANLPRRFDLQRLLSLLFPSSLFFFPSLSHPDATFFSRKTRSRQLLALLMAVH